MVSVNKERLDTIGERLVHVSNLIDARRDACANGATNAECVLEGMLVDAAVELRGLAHELAKVE
jgi:hypothetical protein